MNIDSIFLKEQYKSQSLLSPFAIFILILSSFILLFFVYYPAVRIPHFFLDDTLLLDSYFNVPFFEILDHGGLMGQFRGGRPLTAFGFCFWTNQLMTSSNYNDVYTTMRIFNLSMLSLTCSLCVVWLYYNLQQILFPIFITFLLFFLPGNQVFIASASPATNIFAFPFGILPLFLLGLSNPICTRFADFKKKKVIIRIFLAMLVLQVPLYSYQLYAFIFILPPLVLFLFGDRIAFNIRKVTLLSHIITFYAATLFYRICFKFIFLPLLVYYNPIFQNMPTRTSIYPLSFDLIFTNLKGIFSGEFLTRTFSFWFVTNDSLPSTIFVYFFEISISLYFIITVFRFLKSGFSKTGIFNICQVLFLLTLVFLSVNLVNIRLIPNYTYRASFSHTGFLMILLVFLMKFWVDLFPWEFFRKYARFGVIIIFFVGSGYLAQVNSIDYFSLLTNREILYFEARALPFIFDEVDQIIVKRPIGNMSNFLGDEQGRFLFGDSFYTVHGIMKYLYQKHGLQLPELGYRVIGDWTFAIYKRSPDRSIPLNVTASRKDGNYHVGYAFDDLTGPNSFWEAGPLPISVVIDWPYQHSMNAYTFFNAHGGNRMPVSWRLEALFGDDFEYETVDVQNNVAPWGLQEKRTYFVADSKVPQKYRFTFSKGMQTGIMRIYEILPVVDKDSFDQISPKNLFIDMHTLKQGHGEKRQTIKELDQETYILRRLKSVRPSSILEHRYDPKLILNRFSSTWKSAENTSKPEWIEFEFLEPIQIKTLRMLCQTGPPFSAPRTFVFQGSNQIGHWEDLLRVIDSGFDLQESKELWNHWPLENSKKYIYYRIYLPRNEHFQDSFAINQMRFE
jgi:hypothetical protein